MSSVILSAWHARQEKHFLELVNEIIPTKILVLSKQIDEWVAPTTEEELHAIRTAICLPAAFTVTSIIQSLECCLTLRVPKLDHGNNHGADVLSAILTSLSQSYTTSQSISSNLSNFPWLLGERQAKAAKHPYAPAYKNSVLTQLQYAYDHALMSLHELRNTLSKVHTELTTNMDVLLVPRKKQENNMY